MRESFFFGNRTFVDSQSYSCMRTCWKCSQFRVPYRLSYIYNNIHSPGSILNSLLVNSRLFSSKPGGKLSRIVALLRMMSVRVKPNQMLIRPTDFPQFSCLALSNSRWYCNHRNSLSYCCYSWWIVLNLLQYFLEIYWRNLFSHLQFSQLYPFRSVLYRASATKNYNIIDVEISNEPPLSEAWSTVTPAEFRSFVNLKNYKSDFCICEKNSSGALFGFRPPMTDCIADFYWFASLVPHLSSLKWSSHQKLQ